MILKFLKRYKGRGKFQTMMKKEVEGLILPDSKPYKAKADKTEQCWLKDR